MLVLTRPSNHQTQQYDCTGLGAVNAARYNKNTHLYMKDDEELVRAYGLRVVGSPETLLLHGCKTLDKSIENIDLSDTPEKVVTIISSGYYEIGYVYCHHRSSEVSVQIYDIFLQWAKQPLDVREKTLEQTNLKIKEFNCPYSSASANDPAWYVENERHSKTPVLVSNARELILLSGAFKNRTIALDIEGAEYIRNRIQRYFQGSKK